MSIHRLPNAEALEARRLLSSSFASINSNGTLSVIGTTKADTITVKISGSKVQAILNGATESFTANLVKRLWIDGFSNNDKLINSTPLPSTLLGSTGNDTLVGGTGDDSLEGDDGTDTADYSSRTGNWTFYTAYGHDNYTNNGSATLGTESDAIDPDVETYNGSKGNDIFIVLEYDGLYRSIIDPPAFTLHGGAGDDDFDLGDGGNAVAYGDDGNDQFNISDDGGYQTCYGGSGDDVLTPIFFAGLPYFDGGPGTDSVDAGATFQPTISIANSPSVENVTDIGANGESLLVIGNDLNNYLSGPGPNSSVPVSITLLGGNGNDTLVGANDDSGVFDDANDSLDGGAGNDLLKGQSGNDTLVGGSGNDTLDGGSGNDSLEGDSGIDTADYSTRAGNWAFATPGSTGDGIADGTAICGNETDQINPDVEIYSGSQQDDSFQSSTDWESSGPAYTLHGNGGNDDFGLGDGGHSAAYGDAGDDEFDVNDSASYPESCYGGAGDDWLFPTEYGSISHFDGGTGIDTVYLGQSLEWLDMSKMPNVEDVIGAGGASPEVITGNSSANYIDASGAGYPVTLYGEAGNDTLIGGPQNDLLHGGSGDDTLIGGLGADTMYGEGGTDTADYSDRTENLSITLDGKANDGAVGENDNVGGDIENIITGSGNDFIAGNSFNNSLEGGAGDDTLWGGSGNDTLIGDAGHDQLHGQDGNDVLYGKDGQTDTLDGGDGNDKAQRDNSSSVKDQVLSIESFI